MSLKECISKCQLPLVMTFGNPLLDVIVENENNRLKPLLEKFQMEVDGAVELEREQVQDLFNSLPGDLARTTVAGGSSLNTVRFIQKLVNSERKACCYYGAIGNDERGRQLKELVEAAKVDSRLGVVNGCPTGVTIAIVTDENRSFAAHIGAAGKYSKAMLKDITLPLNKIKILYIEGFFLVHNAILAVEMAKMAEEKKILVAFNLSAKYIIEQNERQVLDFIAFADIVFGNAGEYEALAKLWPLNYERVIDIPFYLNTITSAAPSSICKRGTSWVKKNTCFVMTQGGKAPAVCVYGKNESVEYGASGDALVVRDTTGAGDALVAGFLTGVLAGQAPQTCLDWGCKVAEEVIRHLGATLPEELPEDFLCTGPGSIGSAIFS